MRKQLFLLCLISCFFLQAMDTSGSNDESGSDTTIELGTSADGATESMDWLRGWSRSKKMVVFALAGGTTAVLVSLPSFAFFAPTDNTPIEHFYANVTCGGEKSWPVVLGKCNCEQQPCRCIITSCVTSPHAEYLVTAFSKLIGVGLGYAATIFYAKFGPN